MEAALIGPLGRTALGATKVTIGRAPDNTLVVSDMKASSHHAEIRPEGQNYSIVDLGSTNGTFVNEQQISRGVARQLQPGDIVRVGDTRLTFEMSSTPQSAAPAEEVTERATPPPPPAPNFVGSTSYGMGNYGGGQPSYPPTEYSQPQYSNPPYANPQAPYTPPMQSQYPPYDPELQTPTYIPSSYGQTAPQPPYTQPAPPPQKQSPIRMIVLAVIALVVILAAVGGFLLYQSGQTAQHNANATATAQTQANNATATVVAQQNGTATAVANVNATATAIATSNYPGFTTVKLDDSLTSPNSNCDSNSTCQFSSTGYQVSIQQAHTLHFCQNSAGQYGELAYQVTMSIQQGDCGGLSFRFLDNNNFFFFEVCQNGAYDVGDYVNGQFHDLGFRSNSAIKSGVNQQNVIAVTVQGDTINMFVNGSHIDTVTVQILTSSTFSQGEVGLIGLDAVNPTSIIYTNALVWTA